MQDRFKFRMWNKLSNEMQDVIRINYNLEFPDCSIVVAETNSFDKVKTHTMPITCANSFNNIILMQCTGLKDKNGKLIYEGDIIYKKGSKDYKKEKMYSRVCWDSMYAQFNISDKNGMHQMPCNSNNIEVIGNIYENSELLKDNE